MNHEKAAKIQNGYEIPQFIKHNKTSKFSEDLDCSASRLNTHQFKYASYKLDSFLYLNDAFSLNW